MRALVCEIQPYFAAKWNLLSWWLWTLQCLSQPVREHFLCQGKSWWHVQITFKSANMISQLVALIRFESDAGKFKHILISAPLPVAKRKENSSWNFVLLVAGGNLPVSITLTSRALRDVLRPMGFHWWKHMETIPAKCYGHTSTSVQKDATKKGVTWKKQEGRTNEIVAGTWRPEIVAIVLGNPETHPMWSSTNF